MNDYLIVQKSLCLYYLGYCNGYFLNINLIIVQNNTLSIFILYILCPVNIHMTDYLIEQKITAPLLLTLL